MVNDRMKGFDLVRYYGSNMAVIYDGIFLLLLTTFQDYPLKKPAIVLTTLNPIDLSRVLIMLKLNVGALLGYTGAVFKKFFGTNEGLLIAFATRLVWIAVPVVRLALSSRKNIFEKINRAIRENKQWEISKINNRITELRYSESCYGE